MPIETIDLPELVAIGLLVEGTPDDLAGLLPAAWRRLYEMDTGASAFLKLGLPPEGDRHRELVGFLAARKTAVPEGMTRIIVPAQRYLRTEHDGALTDIAARLERLHVHAAMRGLKSTGFMLDFGYLPGEPAGRHELHLSLDTTTGLLGHV